MNGIIVELFLKLVIMKWIYETMSIINILGHNPESFNRH